MDFKRGDVIIRNCKAINMIEYKGRGVSSNTFYAGAASKKGWGMRMGLKKKYNQIFDTLLKEADLPWMDTYKVVMYYNSRQDSDNTVSLLKFTLDALKQERHGDLVIKKGWVHDDSPAYCKGVASFVDKALPNNTFQIYFLQLS